MNILDEGPNGAGKTPLGSQVNDDSMSISRLFYSSYLLESLLYNISDALFVTRDVQHH